MIETRRLLALARCDTSANTAALCTPSPPSMFAPLDLGGIQCRRKTDMALGQRLYSHYPSSLSIHIAAHTGQLFKVWFVQQIRYLVAVAAVGDRRFGQVRQAVVDLAAGWLRAA